MEHLLELNFIFEERMVIRNAILPETNTIYSFDLYERLVIGNGR